MLAELLRLGARMLGAEQFASVRRLCFDDPTGNEVEALETPIIDLAFNERNHVTQTTLEGMTYSPRFTRGCCEPCDCVLSTIDLCLRACHGGIKIRSDS